MAFYNGRTALTESESQADYVVVTTITLDKTEKDGKVSVKWTPEFDIVDTIGVEPDPEIAAVVEAYKDKLDQELAIEIGTTETALDSRRATVRSQEAAIGNLIADAMRKAVGADVAITNGGGIRADREYAAGTKLTRGDILAELPFGNKTVKLETDRRASIREALENGFSQVEEGAGRFPQVSGLTVEVDLSKPAGRARQVGDGRRRPRSTRERPTRSRQTTSWRAAATAIQVLPAQEPDRPDRRAADGEPGHRLRCGGRHVSARRSRAASRRCEAP